MSLPLLLGALVLVGAVAALLGWRRVRRVEAEQVVAAQRLETEGAQTRRAEAQLEEARARFASEVLEAQKLESLGLLASGVAHDFNNLLGVIRGNAELLRIGVRAGRPNEDQVTAILDASDRARDLTRQILTFTRRARPTRELVDLGRVVRDLQPLLRRLVPRTIRLVVEGTDRPHPILGDPTQLQQLLLNLVANAEHAMREMTDGVLTVQLAADDGERQVVLTVCDTGTGIAPAVQARLFEPFVTTKPEGEGTGLGLAVVHRIVMAHEGRIAVSTGAGTHPAGASDAATRTCFTVRFPQAALDDLWDGIEPDVAAALTDDATDGVVTPTDVVTAVTAEGVEVMPAEAGRGQSGVRIVVVDDEPGVGTVVERSLQHYGHEVRLFHAPEEALTWIGRHPDRVDLLVTDQTMPGLTGDLLAEQVRLLSPGLPVLIVTGYSQRLTPERVAAAGVQRVLFKPVEMEVLHAAVMEALDSARQVTSTSDPE